MVRFVEVYNKNWVSSPNPICDGGTCANYNIFSLPVYHINCHILVANLKLTFGHEFGIARGSIVGDRVIQYYAMFVFVC